MTHSEQAQVFRATFADVIQAHRRVFVERGLTCDMDEDATDRNGGVPCQILRAYEQESLLSLTWPATLLVAISDSGDHSKVSYRVENDSWGPIQQRHTNEFLRSFIADVVSWISNKMHGISSTLPSSQAAREQKIGTSSTRTSAIDQLKQLAELKSQGILTEAEFADAKSRIISRLD